MWISKNDYKEILVQFSDFFECVGTALYEIGSYCMCENVIILLPDNYIILHFK